MNKIEYYRTFLGEVRKATGIESLVCDESGLVSVRVDNTYNLNLQLLEGTDRILCFVEVAALPHDAPKAVYRDLLVGGLFGKDTAGGYFALEPDTGTVVYNYLFDIAKAAEDVEDFVSTLEKILQLCEIWAERIRRVISGEDAEDAFRENSGRNMHLSGSLIRA